ncbi:hypothetical protein QR685DRAFT_419281, partial [Neurospora intermedia]
KAFIKKTGSLNYISTGMRLNITFTINKLYEGNTKPIDLYKIVIKYPFYYLIKTPNLKILLNRKANLF